MTGLLVLYRELVAAGAYVDTYINTRGWIAGRPVIFRVRWMRIPRHDDHLPGVMVRYQNWPRNSTYDVHAYWGVGRNDQDRLLMPVATLDDLWQLWTEIRACLDQPAPQRPEPVGQLDLLDLIGAAA